MEDKSLKIVSSVLLALAVLYVVRQGGCDFPMPSIPGVPAKVTRATYVYEKDEGAVPPGVEFELNEANRAGEIVASVIEDDVVDSTGNTPPQFKLAVAAAKGAGLPALVLESSEGVVKVLQSPNEQQVTEALQ